MKLLVGSLTWCPSSMDERAKQQCLYLDQMEDRKKRYGFDWIVVDNNSSHPLIRERLKTLDAQIIINEHNLGWAIGRNQMIQVFDKSDSHILAMQDSDIFFEDDDWTNRLIKGFEKVPWLHVCQVRTTDIAEGGHDDIIGMKIIEGHIFNWHKGFIGGTNVIDRRALKIIGGYDWKALPFLWGFHDPEYGVRIELAKMHPMGPHLDPARIKKGTHDHGKHGTAGATERGPTVDREYPFYVAKIQKLYSGQAPLFFDYNLMPSEDYINNLK